MPVRPSNGNRNSALFRKGDIEDMLRIFDDLAPERQCGELEGMVNLTDAYLESNWSLAEVLQLVVRKKVPSHRLPTYRLFEALRLDLEVLRALHPFHGKENMSVEQAAEFLGIGESTVSRLVATGALPSHRTRAPRHSLLRRSILKSDVADFGQRYISISEIHKLGIPLRKARRWLQSLGCQPVVFDASVRCTFYQRREVEPHLESFPK